MNKKYLEMFESRQISKVMDSHLSLLALILGLFIFASSEMHSQSCNCTDYVYANDVDLNETHKFRVANDGSLTEVGSPVWGGHDIPDPHGLGVDLNGYSYIAETHIGSIYKLNCDGELIDPVSNDPVGSFANATPAIPNPIDGTLMRVTNYQTKDGILYAISVDGTEVLAIELCTYTLVGRMATGFTNPANSHVWGMYIDDNNWYLTRAAGVGDESREISSGSLDINLYTNPATNSGGVIFLSEYNNIMGITKDTQGNYYTIEQQNQAGGNDIFYIVKYNSAGVYQSDVQNTETNQSANAGNGQAGWWGARGIVYSETSDMIYVGNFENCVSVFNTNLQEQVSLNIGNPLGGDTKAIQIQRECCPDPVTQSIDLTICEGSQVGTKYFLNELFACDGIVCGGEWAPMGAITGMDFNDCDQSIEITSAEACGSFAKSGGGTQPANTCAAFTLNLNISVASVTAPVIAGNQNNLCPTDTPAQLTVTTASASSGTVSYQWQMSTTDCTTGFSNVGSPTATTQPLQPANISVETYYRLLVTTDAGCSSGECEEVSNCVTLTPDTSCEPPCPDPNCFIISVQKN